MEGSLSQEIVIYRVYGNRICLFDIRTAQFLTYNNQNAWKSINNLELSMKKDRVSFEKRRKICNFIFQNLIQHDLFTNICLN